MRLDAIVLLLLLLGAPARADVEGTHPLTDRPFPLRESLELRVPAALLIWHPDDGPTKRKFGEAKLLELLGSRPTLTARSLQVRTRTPLQSPSYGNGILLSGLIAPEGLRLLQATETPFIVTIDESGRIHRLSYFDHWPMLSVLDPRFGPLPPAPKPWWTQIWR